MTGISAGMGMADTVPGVVDVGAVAAGCNMAVGLVGSNHSHLVVHTEVASVKKSSKENTKSNMQLNEIKCKFDLLTQSRTFAKQLTPVFLILSSIDELSSCTALYSHIISEVEG